MYAPITRNGISSYDVVFDESSSSALAYTSRPYSEDIAMHPFVKYTPCATYLREQTDNIITFTHFEDGNILTKTRNDAEIGEKSDDDSIIPLLLSEE